MKQNKTELNKGEIGEQIVSNFFDSNFSKVFSFSSPKTKNNVEIADVLIWLNRTIFLIEVKTRDTEKGTAPIESWAHSQIKKAHSQIKKNILRIKQGEKIYLNNKYYHSELDCDGICNVIGLIVLVYEDKCNIKPSEYLKDIYTSENPIQVISWKDLQVMTKEIETVPDLQYYLEDRFKYIKSKDICLDQEQSVIGYYKLHHNKFPNQATDFSSVNYYDKYKSLMASEISKRNKHNKNAIWIKQIESIFNSQRKLMINIPIGLLFAWELGILSQRERAYYGEKINTVQKFFIEGNSERYFSYQSQNTENWVLFYFTQLDEEPALSKLEELTKLKMIREVEANSFKLGVYSLCFRVSKVYPYQLMEVSGGIVMGIDAIEGNYSQKDVDLAFKKFGAGNSHKIEEFPT